MKTKRIGFETFAVILMCLTSVAHSRANTGSLDSADVAKPVPWNGSFYMSVGVGWDFPTGSISEIGEVVEFPSTSANSIYESNPFFTMTIGGHFVKFFNEIGFGAGPLFLSDKGQELANTIVADDSNVDAEYMSFDYTIGRVFFEGDRWAPFVSVSAGLLTHSLKADDREDENDHGFGMATTLGIDKVTEDHFFVRSAVRYQLLSAGVGAPHQMTFYLMLGRYIGLEP